METKTENKGRKDFNGKAVGIGHKVNYAVKENAHLSRDQIREWLHNDLRGVYVFLAEVMNSKDALEALVEVFWQRYKNMHEAQQNAPELELDKTTPDPSHS